MEIGKVQPLTYQQANGCRFCGIVAGQIPETIVHEWPDAIAIVPWAPVTPGHLVVIARAHVADVGVDPAVSAATVACAAELVATLPSANMITSKGADATQTVFHLHIHVVPRRAGDALALPWTPSQTE